MEFRIDILNYGRHGVTSKEPRTGLVGYGRTKDEAIADLTRQIRHHIDCGYFVEPVSNPIRSIETITI